MSVEAPRTALRWDYAPAPESRDSASLRDSYDLFVGGEFVAPGDGTRVQTINPATEEPLAEVAFAGPKDVARAVEAARAAAPGWQKLPALERGKYLFRIARLIQERARELAVVESLDGGKPIRESRDVDVPLAAQHFFSYAGWADKLQYALGGRAHEPRGVVGQVVPWNFPLLMAAWKLAPALADRQHRGLEARRDDAADRAAAGRDLPGGRPPRGRDQHRHRSTGARAPSSSAPASTRSRSPARPRSARRSSARWPAPARG